MSKSDKINILDNVFSKYIRLKYANDSGYVTCFTCDKVLNWKLIHNGHYYSRRHNSLRFDAKNCFPQCYECNVTKTGNEAEYRRRLQLEFGIVHVLYLDEKKNEFKQFDEAELDLLIGYYRREVVKLAKNKGIKI